MANAEILNRKDALTGFHIKEGLNEYLSSKIVAVYDKVKCLSVIILDLDNFKGINDKYGHLVGDDALRYFSMIINTALKGQHFVARYGGDEFVIAILENTSGKDSMDVANRIKSLLKKEKFFTSAGMIKINTSIGIASFPQSAKTARGLLEVADQALYYAKKHGRNKIVNSRNLMANSIRDRIFLIIQVFIAAGIIFTVISASNKAGSLSGVVNYYRHIYYYLQYKWHNQASKYDHCYLELKNGKSVAGWIIKEDEDTLFLSVVKPTLKLNPSKLDDAATVQPIKIPKIEITSSVKGTR